MGYNVCWMDRQLRVHRGKKDRRIASVTSFLIRKEVLTVIALFPRMLFFSLSSYDEALFCTHTCLVLARSKRLQLRFRMNYSSCVSQFAPQRLRYPSEYYFRSKRCLIWKLVEPDGVISESHLDGVRDDLIVRPFGWKGSFATIREIVEHSRTWG